MHLHQKIIKVENRSTSIIVDSIGKMTNSMKNSRRPCTFGIFHLLDDRYIFEVAVDR